MSRGTLRRSCQTLTSITDITKNYIIAHLGICRCSCSQVFKTNSINNYFIEVICESRNTNSNTCTRIGRKSYYAIVVTTRTACFLNQSTRCCSNINIKDIDGTCCLNHLICSIEPCIKGVGKNERLNID